MKKLLLFIIIQLFLSCSNGDPECVPSKITYRVEGTQDKALVKIAINPIDGSMEPDDGTTPKSIEIESFPFEYTIDEYYPHYMRTNIYMKSFGPNDKVTRIIFIKDGEIVFDQSEFTLGGGGLIHDFGRDTYFASYKW